MLKKTADLATQLLFTLLALYLTILLLRYPAQSLEYAYTGLILWFKKMVPALFPFMILSGIMVRMNLTERFAAFFHPVFHKLFKTSPNGSYAILMGFLCGFPMGARVIGELCLAGRISEEEGEYLLAFCNNIGPIYFISFVMSTLNITHNYIPFMIMYGVPLIYGMILSKFMSLKHKFHKDRSTSAPAPYNNFTQYSIDPPSLLKATDESITSGLIGIGRLGGYMVFFNLLNILFIPFKALPDNFLAFSSCILEITGGISRTGAAGLYMILILLPFGGFSCMAQTYSMIKDTRLSIRKYFLHKCIQTAITAIIYLFCVFSSSASAFL